MPTASPKSCPGASIGFDYNGAWGRFANGVLMHVFKVRQSGTQIDVSHMMRLGDNPANPLVCRAFYRATDVPGNLMGSTPDSGRRILRPIRRHRRCQPSTGART